MYLRLLAFSGGFPTVVLFGMLPALAALVLRRRLGGKVTAPTPPLVVPGGRVSLAVVALLSCAILATSLVLLAMEVLANIGHAL